MILPSDLAPELRALDRRFVLARVNVPLAGCEVTIETPRSADELISEIDFERDERLPALGRRLAVLDRARGRRRGARRARQACAGARLRPGARHDRRTARRVRRAGNRLLRRRAAVRAPERAERGRPRAAYASRRLARVPVGPSDGLTSCSRSDVLYEREYATLVASAIVASLAPGGVALVADPGRVALLSFVTACEQRGCSVGIRARVPWTDGTAKQTITIHEVTSPSRR